MKIVIAPDSFKESLAAEEIAQAIKKRIPKIDSRCRMSALSCW